MAPAEDVATTCLCTYLLKCKCVQLVLVGAVALAILHYVVDWKVMAL